MNIQIKKFDPSKMDPCRTCVFIAKKNCGKSTLIKDILYHQRKIPMGVVMSGTEESNEHYQQFVPDSFIYGQYEPEVIEHIITHQQQVVKKLKQSEKNTIINTIKNLTRKLECVGENSNFSKPYLIKARVKCSLDPPFLL